MLVFAFIPIRLIKLSILREENRVDNKAKISLFSCSISEIFNAVNVRFNPSN